MQFMKKWLVAWPFALLALPAGTHASVIISEIMYDLQTGSDSGREWVEVFNAGSNTVRLSDWKLFEANVSHSITAHTGGDDLSSGSYAIIADNPAKFLEDWPGYSGLLFDSAFSLANGGETLGIRSPGTESMETDSVSYSSTLGAAGDGNTLRRTESVTNTFTPGAASPGSGNLQLIPGLSYTAPVQESSEDTETTQSTTTAKAQPVVSSYVPPPVPQIFADGGGDRTVIVGADVEFRGRAYNRSQELVDNVRFSWNFGDGSTQEGTSVRHHFSYPGKYAVVLSIALDRSAASDRIIVTAEPAKLGFSTHSDGSISIENLSGRDLDLSFWLVRSFMNTFSLPEGSAVLSGQTLRIPQKTLGFFSTDASAQLLYPNGEVALRAGERSETAAPDVREILEPTVVSMSGESSTTDLSHANTGSSQPLLDAEDAIVEEARQIDGSESESGSEQLAASAAVFAPRSYWWIGAIVLALITAGGAMALNRMRKSEWDIIGE